MGREKGRENGREKGRENREINVAEKMWRKNVAKKWGGKMGWKS